VKQKLVRLGDVAEFQRDSVSPLAIRSGTAYVGLEHIDGSGAIKEVRAAPGELASSKFRFSSGHVLYGKLRPYLRKIARPSFSGICSTDVIPIRPGPRIDRDYLFYVLRQDSLVAMAASLATGINLPRISPKTLETFEIPLPPLDQQRRLAAILDQVDDLRRKRRQTLERLGRLTQSLFLDALGNPVANPKQWPRVSFSDVIDKIEGGWSPVCLDRPVRDGEWGVLKLGSITWCEYEPGENKALPADVQPEPALEVKNGDLLFTRKNTYDLVAACALD
jgi:type I restriction enzyme, S subunit